MRLLIVAMAESVHTARWVSQIADQGWDIHLFPSVNCGIVHPGLRNITVHNMFRGRQTIDPSIRHKGIPVFNDDVALAGGIALERFFPQLKVRKLRRLVHRIQPDIIHSMEIQHAGYLTLEAMKGIKGRIPTWIVTSWGSDISLFGRLEAHKERLREVLSSCDYLCCDCRRDISPAVSLGFKGVVLPVMPGGGGLDMEMCARSRQPGRVSERRIIMLKGYQGWSGRALVGLRALERCADVLKGFEVFLYSASPEVLIAAELFSESTGVPVTIVPPLTSHSEMLVYYGKARISIGVSVSDGATNSLLESMAMGSFPIQSWTACADEWIEDGKTGLLVPPDDPDVVEKAIRRALTDDELINVAAESNYRMAQERLDQSLLKPKAVNIYRYVAEHYASR